MAGLLATSCAGGEEDVLIFPDDPATAVGMITGELAEGNGEIIWDALPRTYQSDINSVVYLLSEKLDAEVYDKCFCVIRRIIDVANGQENFILNTRFGGKFSAESLAKIVNAWPSIIVLAECISNSEIADLVGLQSFDGRSFFDNIVSSFIGITKGRSLSSGERNPFVYSNIDLLKTNNNRTILRLTSPDGTADRMEFTNLQGRLIPTYIADNWVKTITKIKRNLEAINPKDIAKNKPQVITLLSMFEVALKQIEIAETQIQFDQSVQRAVLPLMGLLLLLIEIEN